jgi:LysM repeat protein
MPTVKLRVSFFGLAAFLAVLLVACGGNGDNGGASGAPRLTDPAAAPAAEPVAEDQVYRFRGDSVTVPTGASATLPERPTTGGSGENGNGETPANGSAPSGETYTVQPGDTCGGIASTLGISVDALMSANPEINADCSNLQVEQVLRVPGGAPVQDDEPGDDDTPITDEPEPTPATGSGQTYEIQPGDICLTIANQFGVDVDELIALNNLNCTNLQVGDVIQIP